MNQGLKKFCPDFGHFRRRFALFRRRLRVFKRRLNFQKPDFRPLERLFGVFKRHFSPKIRDLRNVKSNVKIR